MRKQINLIPNDLVVTPKTVKITKIINRITILGVLIFLISSAMVIISFLYLNNQYQQDLVISNSLKSEISNLEQSEQKLILAKNKLKGISTIKKLNLSEIEISKLKFVLDSVLLSTNSKMTEFKLSSTGSEMSFVSPDSESVSNLIKAVTNSGLYKNVTMESLNKKTDMGYLTTFLFSNE